MSSGAPGIHPDWLAASGLFQCLSAPLRIGIIALLAERPHTVSDLVAALDAPQPLISQHLRVLRESCLVDGVRTGRVTTYGLMDEHVAHIVRDGIAHAAEHDPHVPRTEHSKPRKDPS